MSLKNLDNYDGAQQDLQYQAEEYLRGKGWTHTSSTGPGCYWMWLRPMPAEVATAAVPAGALILVDFETAVRMQKSWEAWTADLAAPDEEGLCDDDDEPPHICAGCIGGGLCELDVGRQDRLEFVDADEVDAYDAYEAEEDDNA